MTQGSMLQQVEVFAYFFHLSLTKQAQNSENTRLEVKISKSSKFNVII